MMRIFDLLIDNNDRNPAKILVEANHEQLVWINHSRAFSKNSRLSVNIDKPDIQLTPQLQKVLKSLSKEQLERTLGDLLNPEQISALIKRRDHILKMGLQTGQ
jgi:hypothetical protein